MAIVVLRPFRHMCRRYRGGFMQMDVGATFEWEGVHKAAQVPSTFPVFPPFFFFYQLLKFALFLKQWLRLPLAPLNPTVMTFAQWHERRSALCSTAWEVYVRLCAQ